MTECFEASALCESQLFEAIRRMAASDCPVLVMGERGVGKNCISQLLHALSPRSAAPYHSIRAADADRSRIAALLPGSGTLVVAEVTDLSLTAQRELVRSYLDLATPGRNRLVCTTSQDLAEGVRNGGIREDFYYLISAVSLRVPPLRHRKGQLLTLAEQLLAQYAKQFGRPKPMLSAEMRSFLLGHSWPGNLDELEASMKTCVAIGDPSFSIAALRAAMPKTQAAAGNARQTSLKAATRAACIQVERQLIAEALKATDGNRKQTAKELRISYKTLLYKLKQSGVVGTAAGATDGARS